METVSIVIDRQYRFDSDTSHKKGMVDTVPDGITELLGFVFLRV